MTATRRGLLLGAASLALAAPALAQAPATREVVDAAGRRVAVPAAPRRVFPAGPGAAVLVAVLAPDRLAGWPTPLPARAAAFLPAVPASLPTLGRLTGSAPSADAQRIRASGADLVLDIGTVDAAYAAVADRAQAGSQVPAVLLDGALARTPALLREAGTLLGAAARGEALATAAGRVLAETSAARAGGAGPRLWYGRGPRALSFAFAAGINAEVPALLGCALPAHPGGGGWGTATPADLAAFDPEVALVGNREAATALRADPLWAATAAGRAGLILAAPADPFGWVDGPPSVQRLLGLRWLLSALRPDALPRAAMRAEAAGLIGLLFGAAISDPDIEALVAG